MVLIRTYACLLEFNAFQHEHKACYWASIRSHLHQAMWCRICRQVGTFLIQCFPLLVPPMHMCPDCLINHVLRLVILWLHVHCLTLVCRSAPRGFINRRPPLQRLVSMVC